MNDALLHGSTAVVGIETDSWAAKSAALARNKEAKAIEAKAAFNLKLRRLIENGDLCRNCEDMITDLWR